MFAALSTTPASLSSDADAVESVRILVVGNPGCGKSTLAHALATGKPPTRPPPQTAGCSVWVRMIDADPDTSSTSTSAPRPLAVELWDVGCARRYAPLRRLFYGDAAGVLLCHDLGTSPPPPTAAAAGAPGGDTASSSRAAAVRPWVAELAAATGGGGAGLGGAAGQQQQQQASTSSLAGLPFPAALVGTKADRAGGARGKGTPAVLVDAVALGLAGGGWATAASRAWRGLGMSRAASFTRRWSGVGGGGAASTSSGHLGSAGGASPPPVRPGLTAMHTSAVLGDVDAAAFDDFFRRCAAGARGRGPGGGGGGGGGPHHASSAAAAWGATYGSGGGGGHHVPSAAGDGLGGEDDDLV